MEGSVQPVDGAPTPKKPKMLMYAVIAVVAVIVVAAIAVVALGGGGSSNPSTTTYSPKAGYYIHYKTDMTAGDITMTSWTNITIKSVSSDSMVVNTTISGFGLGEISSETSVPLNETTISKYDPINPPQGITVTKVGSETISTKWGTKLCDHYTMSAEGVTTDVWISGGQLIKVRGTQDGYTVTMTIDATNISAITG